MRITNIILLKLTLVSFIHIHYCIQEGKIPKDGKGKESKGKISDAKSKGPKEDCGKLGGKTNGGMKSSGTSYFLLELTFEGTSGFSITGSAKDAILSVIAAELAVSPCSLGNAKVSQTAATSITFSVMATLSESVMNSLKLLSLDASSLLATLQTKITIPGGVTIASFTLDSSPLLSTESPTTNPTANPSANPTITPTATPTVTPTARPTTNPTAPTSAPSLGIMDIRIIPREITHDSDGNKYITDSYYNVIRKISPTGVPSLLAGVAGTSGSSDGPATSATFNNPFSSTVDAAGSVFVADYNNHIIRKVSPTGDVTTIAGEAGVSGSTNGDGTTARFYYPQGSTNDPSGNLFISDSYNQIIRKIVMSENSVTVSTFAGAAGLYSLTDGVGAASRFRSPQGLTIDNSGNIYVADCGNSAIRKITPGATVTTIISSLSACPADVVVDSNGAFYSVFTFAQVIIQISSDGSDVVAWAGSESSVHGYSDGTGTEALFYYPVALDIDESGNVFVADYSNHVIRKIDPSQRVTTYAGKH